MCEIWEGKLRVIQKNVGCFCPAAAIDLFQTVVDSCMYISYVCDTCTSVTRAFLFMCKNVFYGVLYTDIVPVVSSLTDMQYLSEFR